MERPEVAAKYLGDAPASSTRERTLALNSHINRILKQNGFYRAGSLWVDPEDWVRIEGFLLSGPHQGKPFPIRQHQAYSIEAICLDGIFYALVDLSKQVLSDLPLGALDKGVMSTLEAAAPRHRLKAVELATGKSTDWKEAGPKAHLLLHPGHLSQLGITGKQGGFRSSLQEAFEASQFDFADLLRKVGSFKDFLVPEPLAVPTDALFRVEGRGLRMAKGMAAEPKEVRRLGFLSAPQSLYIRPVFPEGVNGEVTSVTQYEPSTHIEIQERGRPPQRSGKLAHTLKHSYNPRWLLLYHLVPRSDLEKSQKGKEILAHFTPANGENSLQQELERLGVKLQLLLPAIRYAPLTGEVARGAPSEATTLEKGAQPQINLILAPAEVRSEALKRLIQSLKSLFPNSKGQVVQPKTLMGTPPNIHSLAYDLLVRLCNAVPYALACLDHPILGLRTSRDEGYLWRLLSPEGFVLAKGSGLPKTEELPHRLVIHFLGSGQALDNILSWTHHPVVWIERTNLRFSHKKLPLGTYFLASSEMAYLLVHPGHPGWPRALRIQVAQGDLPLEQAVAQVYWLSKPAGGLYHPGTVPLSVADETEWDKLRHPGTHKVGD
ncbi:hypothetical protein [Thermus sp. 2.9]|uniref:hypothetical protein n=1 Tax=Thermus sp. (strain 2.9) TaxID=1577051 RepID=UPI00126A1DBF|nr:hypothetical protein [Thermus sp. 2.9]